MQTGAQQPQAPAPVEPGNIDVSKQPTVWTEQGPATVRSAGVNVGGEEVLLPTVSAEGRLLSVDEAVELYKETGKHLGKFKTAEESTAAGKQLSEQEWRRLHEGVDPGIGYTPPKPLSEKLMETWPARMVTGPLEGAKAGMEAVRSGKPVTSEQLVGPMTEAAGGAMTGGVPTLIGKGMREGVKGLVRESQNTARSFAGTTASNLTLKQRGNLAAAVTLERLGRDPQKIWKGTGWWRGMEGKWRTEISDVGARLHPSLERVISSGHAQQMTKPMTLDMKQVMEHPQLFKAYPEIGKLKVKIDPKLATEAELDVTNGVVSINPALHRTPNEFITSLIHETQHKIQFAERFNLGASPASRLSELKAELAVLTANKPEEVKKRMQELFTKLTKDPEGKRSPEYMAYSRTPGELESLIVEMRRDWEIQRPGRSKEISPMEDLADIAKQGKQWTPLATPAEKLGRKVRP